MAIYKGSTIISGAQDVSDAVHKSGAETITGTKTFYNNSTAIKSNTIDWATIPSTDHYSGITILDKNGKRIGKLEQYQIKDTGEIRLGLNVSGYDASGNIKYSPILGVSINKDGTGGKAYTSTPVVSSNDSSIATTAWVKSVSLGAPDYANHFQISNPWTADRNGFAFNDASGGDMSQTIYVNGIPIAHGSTGHSGSHRGIVPVAKGDVVSCAGRIPALYFVPLK